MSRFQAMTSTVLDDQLAFLREQLGLRENQKADLLREIVALAAWVVHQARQGRTVEAHGASGVEVLEHPALGRLPSSEADVLQPLFLEEPQARYLVQILDRPFSPTPGLREALRRLADEHRAPPDLRWPQEG